MQTRLKYLIIIVLLFNFFTANIVMAEEKIQVKLTAQPDFTAILPDEDLVKFALSVYDSQGQPVNNVKIEYQLESPAKSRLISTDFPVVEGTRLMEGSLLSNSGTWLFEYLLPIRGQYHLKVKVSPTKDSINFTPVTKEIDFNINEKPSEVRNALLLSGGLLILGLISGIIIGRSARAKKEVM